MLLFLILLCSTQQHYHVASFSTSSRSITTYNNNNRNFKRNYNYYNYYSNDPIFPSSSRLKYRSTITLNQISQAHQQAEADNDLTNLNINNKDKEKEGESILQDNEKENKNKHEKKKSGVINVASYKALLTFVGTTILIWLSEPLLSIIDTTVIGRSTATDVVTQLAALGPATLVIDNLIYLTYFLGIATTNKIAKEYAENNSKAQRKTISHVLGLALVMGLIITSTIFIFGEQILTKMVLNEKALLTMDTQTMQMNLNLIKSALEYTKIRSVVAPLAVMGIMAQSAALASLDTFTPFLAVIMASITNIIGDYVLCIKPFQLGIRGAAIATASATTAGSLTLLFKTKQRLKNLKKKQQQQNNKSKDNIIEEKIPFASLPNKKEFNKLIRLAGPIFFVIVGKLLTYSTMTIKVTPFGIIPLASYNIMMRIFFFCATFGDSLSQSAQTFLPQVIYNKNNNKKKEYNNNNNNNNTSITKVSNLFSTIKQKLYKKPVVKLLFRLSVVAALVSFTISNTSTYVLGKKASLFTTDTSISTMIAKYSKWIGISVMLHPFILLTEGAIIAKRDLKFLVSSYVATILALMAQLNFACFEFVDVLKSLFFFQFSRFILFSTRVMQTIVLKDDTITVKNGDKENN